MHSPSFRSPNATPQKTRVSARDRRRRSQKESDLMPKHTHDTLVAPHEPVPTETAVSASAAAVADRPETDAQLGMARQSGSGMNEHSHVHHALARPFRMLLARHH